MNELPLQFFPPGPAGAKSRGRKTSRKLAECPDWLPAEILPMLAHPKEDVRRTVEDHVAQVAQEIFCAAYFKWLRQRVPLLMARGMPYPGQHHEEVYPEIVFSRDLLARSRREMSKEAEEEAEKDASAVAQNTTDTWISEQDAAWAWGSGYERGSLVPLLGAALAELRDAPLAHQCALVWLQLSRASGWFRFGALPPSWRQVGELIREHPALMTVGPAEMLCRGWLPPPWFTAAIS